MSMGGFIGGVGGLVLKKQGREAHGGFPVGGTLTMNYYWYEDVIVPHHKMYSAVIPNVLFA